MSLQLVGEGQTKAAFLQAFNRLCVALREPADDSGVTQGIYYDALKDVPLPAVEAGAVALSKERGRRFFPTTAEWRTAAQAALQAQLRHVECDGCEDTGWVLGLTCDGSNQCGRKRVHLPHTWTYPCPCRETNRTYIRSRQYGAGAA